MGTSSSLIKTTPAPSYDSALKSLITLALPRHDLQIKDSILMVFHQLPVPDSEGKNEASVALKESSETVVRCRRCIYVTLTRCDCQEPPLYCRQPTSHLMPGPPQAQVLHLRQHCQPQEKTGVCLMHFSPRAPAFMDTPVKLLNTSRMDYDISVPTCGNIWVL